MTLKSSDAVVARRGTDTERTRLNEDVVEALPAPPSGNRVTYFGGAVLQGAKAPPGFGVRVTSAGAKAFVINYRHEGRERRLTIGAYPTWSALKAVKHARELRQRIDRGEDPLAQKKAARIAKAATAGEGVVTVNSVLDAFLERYVKRGGLRTAKKTESVFERLVRPRIGAIPVHELRRSQIVKMLDEIADENGAGQADHTLSHIRKALGWWAIKDDDFSSPIIRGMARTKPSERARKRTLSDDEIWTLWAALDTVTEPTCYSRFVKTLLLTGQRRDEVARMRFQEIADDGVWTIPAERYKTKIPNHVPLSAAARALIGVRAEGTGPFVFSTTNGKVPFSGYSVARKLLDERMAALWQGPPQDRWVLHDLRRTAKTLMQRAKVRPDISERVLGHAIAGVEGTYDRYDYLDEKRDALDRLAAMVDRILSGKSNVVPLDEAREGSQHAT